MGIHTEEGEVEHGLFFTFLAPSLSQFLTSPERGGMNGWQVSEQRLVLLIVFSWLWNAFYNSRWPKIFRHFYGFFGKSAVDLLTLFCAKGDLSGWPLVVSPHLFCFLVVHSPFLVRWGLSLRDQFSQTRFFQIAHTWLLVPRCPFGLVNSCILAMPRGRRAVFDKFWLPSPWFSIMVGLASLLPSDLSR